MELINDVKASALPRGHYSQAVVHNGLVYVSGQLGINPHTQSTEVGTIKDQTENILTSIASILIAANSHLNKTLKITIYLTDISDWETVNGVYARFFGEHKPARIVIPTSSKFHLGFQIAIDVIACT